MSAQEKVLGNFDLLNLLFEMLGISLKGRRCLSYTHEGRRCKKNRYRDTHFCSVHWRILSWDFLGPP